MALGRRNVILAISLSSFRSASFFFFSVVLYWMRACIQSAAPRQTRAPPPRRAAHPQFPDRIRQLVPVTQLYVSVDASNPEALKRVDRRARGGLPCPACRPNPHADRLRGHAARRPLFSDYWERFTSCLTALRDKRQRTVYRLTLVRGKNPPLACSAASAGFPSPAPSYLVASLPCLSNVVCAASRPALLCVTSVPFP